VHYEENIANTGRYTFDNNFNEQVAAGEDKKLTMSFSPLSSWLRYCVTVYSNTQVQSQGEYLRQVDTPATAEFKAVVKRQSETALNRN
jgi:hypothetical protein